MGPLATLAPGDVVVADFPGAMGVKRRPAVVLSGSEYHGQRPDVILGAITTNLLAATTEFDTPIHDWAAAGLHRESAFRTFLVAVPRTQVLAHLGVLTAQDWLAVCGCVRRAIPEP